MPLTTRFLRPFFRVASPSSRPQFSALQLYVSTLLIFLISRAVVVAGLFFSRFVVTNPNPTIVHLQAGDAWYDRLLRWDAWWYFNIAEHGYSYSSDPSTLNSVAFFPLYPLIAFGLKSLFGISTGTALLLVANLSALLVTALMTRLVRHELGDETALLSVALFCFSPFSIFLSAGYSEPLCLVFVLLSLILLTQERYLLASLAAALSLATRSVGLVIVPVILWEIWQRKDVKLPRMLLRMLVCGIVATSSLIIFMAYLGFEFGNPFAFADAQNAWNEGAFSHRFLAALALGPFANLSVRDDIWFLCVLALTMLSFWRLRFGLALYALGTLALPYFTLGIPHPNSMNRFTLMCFPAFISLATLCKSREWIALGMIGAFGALLLGATALFSQWYWIG